MAASVISTSNHYFSSVPANKHPATFVSINLQQKLTVLSILYIGSFKAAVSNVPAGVKQLVAVVPIAA